MNRLAIEVARKFLAKDKDEYAAGILFYCPDDDTVLLTKRSGIMKHPHTWDIPGGRADDDDKSIEATARREATEELGCLPENMGKLLRIYQENVDREGDGNKHPYHIYLRAISEDTKIEWTPKIELDEESIAIEWRKVDELPLKEKFHFDLKWVPEAIAKVKKEKGLKTKDRTASCGPMLRFSSQNFKPRYERKYWVQASMIPAIRSFLLPYVTADEHGLYYPIHNIYFDNDQLQLFSDHVGGKPTHFKLRARTYDQDNRIFLEVKSKTKGVCSKQRSIVPQQSYDEVFRTATALTPIPFIQLASEYHSKPIIRLDYDREAYNAHEASGRVTFDRNVRFARQLLPVFAEPPDQTLLPPDMSILELKYSAEEMPKFMKRLVKAFGLKRSSISKYCLSVTRLLQDRKLGMLKSRTASGYSYVRI